MLNIQAFNFFLIIMQILIQLRKVISWCIISTAKIFCKDMDYMDYMEADVHRHKKGH